MTQKVFTNIRQCSMPEPFTAAYRLCPGELPILVFSTRLKLAEIHTVQADFENWVIQFAPFMTDLELVSYDGLIIPTGRYPQPGPQPAPTFSQN